MPMLWIFYFISCLLFTSSQYIYSNKNVDCKSDEKYKELLGEIQTLRRQQIKLQRELNEQRQDNKEIRDLLVSRNLTSGKMPFDCSDIYKNGERKTGIYKIYPSDEINKGVSAFCYMYPQLGGQTVIQKRFGMYYSNFNRTWDDFKRGFGYVGGDYWLGNDVIHKLTTTFPNDLYIKIKGYFDVKYSSFSISDEANGYRLSLGTKSGNI
ncbi:angiopoietin-related protein 7-like, partial [Saccostrea cucullata]|uniref:angiopoietin-related protein 7-like n=1 Tax=Saccostrea cuccullata TaxID=36930 RepID=UPI002ED5E013